MKLERRQFYALFGDFDTGLTVNELARYSRSFNGVKTELRSGNVGFNAFAAQTGHGFHRDEIRGDGTSGVYRLTRPNIIINSEKIALEVRDRFRPEVIVSNRVLTRHLDYRIDHHAGTLVFKAPVPNRDEDLNPVYIVADYEVRDPDANYNTFGGRGAVRTGDEKLEVGSTFVRQEDQDGTGDLLGWDARYRFSQQTEFKGEYVLTDTDATGRARAWLTEFKNTAGRFNGRAYWRVNEEGFGLGQQNRSEKGTRKIGAGPGLPPERHGARVQDPRLPPGQPHRWHRRARPRARRGWTTPAGKRWSRPPRRGPLRRRPRSPMQPDRVLDPGAARGAGLQAQDSRLTLTLDHEQALNGRDASVDFPTRTTVGADYEIVRNLDLLTRYEWTHGLAGSTQGARVGFQARPWTGGEFSSSWERQARENGTRAFANLGARQTWQIDPRWSVSGGLDFSQATGDTGLTNPSAYGTPEDFTATSLGVNYRGERWQWNNRLEFHWSDQDDRWILAPNLLVEPGQGLALAASALVSGGRLRDHADLRLGLARRRTGSRLAGARPHRPGVRSLRCSRTGRDHLAHGQQLEPQLPAQPPDPGGPAARRQVRGRHHRRHPPRRLHPAGGRGAAPPSLAALGRGRAPEPAAFGDRRPLRRSRRPVGGLERLRQRLGQPGLQLPRLHRRRLLRRRLHRPRRVPQAAPALRRRSAGLAGRPRAARGRGTGRGGRAMMRSAVVSMLALAAASGAWAQTLTSRIDQTFSVGDRTTWAETSTSVDDSPTGTINRHDDLRLTIPAGFGMRWDRNVWLLIMWGSASNKVRWWLPDFEDGGRTMVLDVREDFAPGDWVIIYGARFTDFSSASPPDRLELDVNNDGRCDAYDQHTIAIGDPLGGNGLTLLKSVTCLSDPHNGFVNAKAIPGAELLYTIRTINGRQERIDRNSLVMTDAVPVGTRLYVGDIDGDGSGPVLFEDGAVSSGLRYRYRGLTAHNDDLEFSADGGASFTYTPLPDGGGYDARVTHWRVRPRGWLRESDGAAHPEFSLRFRCGWSDGRIFASRLKRCLFVLINSPMNTRDSKERPMKIAVVAFALYLAGASPVLAQDFSFDEFVGSWEGTISSESFQGYDDPITLVVEPNGFYTDSSGHLMPSLYPNTQMCEFEISTNRVHFWYLQTVYAGMRFYQHFYYEVVEYTGNSLELHIRACPTTQWVLSRWAW